MPQHPILFLKSTCQEQSFFQRPQPVQNGRSTQEQVVFPRTLGTGTAVAEKREALRQSEIHTKKAKPSPLFKAGTYGKVAKICGSVSTRKVEHRSHYRVGIAHLRVGCQCSGSE